MPAFLKNEAEKYLELPYAADLTDKLITVDRTEKYLGHPDIVQTDSGRVYAFYPAGHGRGSIIARYSDDFGLTWSDRLTGLPESWTRSRETPTVYRLNMISGKSKLVLISGAPKWPVMTRGGETYLAMRPDGFNCSVSVDDGKSWSEFENFYSPRDAIVAMSSLTQVKENGVFVDKWLGTFHDHNFINYKTYLTFDGDKPVWSTPEPLLSMRRKTEKRVGICEVEIIRTPNDELLLFGRAEKRKTRSVICLSRDEGNTWTKPVELPYVLSGDRHKAEYDPESKKVIVSFRQILPIKKGLFGLKKTLASDGWVAWIGTFDDLISMAENNNGKRFGEKYYLLGRLKSGADCGYSGVVIKDKKALLVSYGAFDEKAENPYIAAVCVKME